MQGVKIGLLILLLSPLAQAGNRWDTTVAGGSMHFQGVIMAAPCSVEVGDRQLIVNMGQISSNRFHSQGENADPVPFDIHLQDCSTTVRQRVGLSFSGVADGKNPDVLSVGEGPGIATGVGIALFDSENQLIPLNSPPTVWKKLYIGSNTLHLVARYWATGNQVTGGEANAQVSFSLTYQ